MFNATTGQTFRVLRGRSLRAATAGAALLALTGAALGCNETENNAFRDAAAPALEAGVDSLLGALVDGAFAVLETTRDDSSDTTATQ